MPTYEYVCRKCGHKLEAFQKITESPLTTCPQCSQEALQRGPGGGIGLSFSGSGWYKTDYASSLPPQEGKTASQESNKSECCPCNKPKGSCSS